MLSIQTGKDWDQILLYEYFAKYSTTEIKVSFDFELWGDQNQNYFSTFMGWPWRKGTLSWYQTQAFHLHRSCAQRGILADWVLWVFFANGKIVVGGFSLITLIKIFFSQPLLFSSENWFNLFDIVSCFKILSTHCSFYSFSDGTSGLSETLFLLTRTADRDRNDSEH